MPIVRLEKMEVRQRRPLSEISAFEFKRGLVAPPRFPWLRAEVASSELLPTVQERAPVDGREIVSWMQVAAAEGALLEGTCGDYNRLGSLLLSDSGDPYIPGVAVGDLTARSMTGDEVRRTGRGIVMTGYSVGTLFAAVEGVGLNPD